MGHDHSHHAHNNEGHSSTKNIWIAFLLNLFFAIIEIVGGILTGSMAIIADAIHDFGDALSLGLALVLQRVSERKRSENFSYGYGRFSLLSALITGGVILTGSTLILLKSAPKILSSETVTPHGLGMLGLAVFGIAINGAAAFRLKTGKTRNEKVLTWHFIEDLLGWVAVLVGAVLILLTDWKWIDPLLACLVSLFVIFNVVRNLIATSKLFLQSIPEDFDKNKFRDQILKIRGVKDTHDIHAWSMDGRRNIISLHIVVDGSINSEAEEADLKNQIKKLLDSLGEFHPTIEIERASFECAEDCDTA